MSSTIFRIILDETGSSGQLRRASDINEAMRVAVAKALADLVSDEELNEDYIIPNALDERVAPAVAKAVAQAARESGVARI